jgi:hypothetical protein
MMTKCYVVGGELIHIGEWDLFPGIPRDRYPALAADIKERAARGTPPVILTDEQAMQALLAQATNPLPDGATAEQRDIVETENGKFEASDYARLRRPEYPPIGDQLDALWKGGDAAAEMLARVQAVKAKYPKPE